jgi:hypothetical protein
MKEISRIGLKVLTIKYRSMVFKRSILEGWRTTIRTTEIYYSDIVINKNWDDSTWFHNGCPPDNICTIPANADCDRCWMFSIRAIDKEWGELFS